MSVLGKMKDKIAARHPKIAGQLIQFVGRAQSPEQRKLQVRYDGRDWIHTWEKGTLVADRPYIRPHGATHSNLPLFFKHHRPGKGATVLDVGAGIGTELPAFSRAVGDNGRVVCIEADPEAFRLLQKAVEVEGLKNVALANVAVSDSEGEVVLSQLTPGSQSNALVTDKQHGLSVPATTLDSLLDSLGVDEVDYVKMNIEGAEIPALKGFSTGPTRVRNWCISCHDHQGRPESMTFDWVENWLRQNGLTVWRHEPMGERAVETYYLFARRKDE